MSQLAFWTGPNVRQSTGGITYLSKLTVTTRKDNQGETLVKAMKTDLI